MHGIADVNHLHGALLFQCQPPGFLAFQISTLDFDTRALTLFRLNRTADA